MRKPIRLFKVRMANDIEDYVLPVLKSSYIGEGPKVKEFEEALKQRFESDFVLAINSATSAEHLALHLLKKPMMGFDPEYAQFNIGVDKEIWPGATGWTEVLTTPLTCTATNWPILANGMAIKWVDVDPNTMNMDLDDLARKITRSTKIIMLVHWGGYPVDMDRVRQICDEAEGMYGFRPMVIQDCAHALGSTYKSKPLTAYGDICTFSFQAIKHMTCGDGGALVVNHKQLYERGKLLRWYGIDRETNRKDFRCEADIPEWGFKFHMNDINASIGLANLSLLDDTVSRHIDNAAYYDAELLFESGISLLSRHHDRQSAFWIYTMRVEDRDGFMRHMKDCNVEVSRVHERNDKHSCVSQYRAQLPGLERAVGEMICIPVGWWVTEADREYIVDCIRKGW